MKIKLNNVGIINKCDVEFLTGFNIIVGNSGSGKSTLMRAIHNIATNEFSDSDISFGKNTMNIEVASDNNTVSYTRSIKSRGDKFYYTVNGEKYAKVGRSELQAVSDTLKIGNQNINGEDINFNFNLQFATPFLIFGSQSTLYNVLTYRSQFDVSSMNDYYNQDVKANKNEIATNTEVKNQFEQSLESLKKQEVDLKPIENLYSRFIIYKHKSTLLNDLKKLYSQLVELNATLEKISNISKILIKIEKCVNLFNQHSDCIKLYNNIKSSDKIEDRLSCYSDTLNNCRTSIQLLELLKDLLSIRDMLVICNKLKSRMQSITNCLQNIESNKYTTEMLNDFVRQHQLLRFSNKCNNIIKILKRADSTKISLLEDFININNVFNQIENINSNMMKVRWLESEVNNKMSTFKVCPLCGNHLGVYND
jgi:DNA repair ATPase RecN